MKRIIKNVAKVTIKNVAKVTIVKYNAIQALAWGDARHRILLYAVASYVALC